MANTSLDVNPNLRQAAKFAVVGVANTSIDFILFAILYYAFAFPIILANTIAYIAGTVNGFFWNKRWTFSEQRHQGRVGWQLPIFVGLYTIGLCLSNITVWFLAPLMSPIIAKAIAVVVTFIWNFLSTRRFVYKSH